MAARLTTAVDEAGTASLQLPVIQPRSEVPVIKLYLKA